MKKSLIVVLLMAGCTSLVAVQKTNAAELQARDDIASCGSQAEQQILPTPFDRRYDNEQRQRANLAAQRAIYRDACMRARGLSPASVKDQPYPLAVPARFIIEVDTN